jgi:hypothetical protein
VLITPSILLGSIDLLPKDIDSAIGNCGSISARPDLLVRW